MVQVAIPGPGRLLTYAIPAHMGADRLTGRRVLVPLGNRQLVGLVVAQTRELPGEDLRSVLEVLDREQPSFGREMLALLQWVAEYYMAELAEVFSAALPAGLMHPPEKMVLWTGEELEGQWPAPVQSDHELRRLARALAGQGRTGFQRIVKRVGRAASLTNLQRLEELGLVQVSDRLKLDRQQANTVEWVRLARAPEEGEIRANAVRQQKLIALLESVADGMVWPDLQRESGASRAVLNTLVENGLVSCERVDRPVEEFGFDPRESGERGQALPEMTAEQQAAVDALMGGGEPGYAPSLLAGLPGTGKTRVYIECIRETLAQERGAIVLVPEIALTPQVVARIKRALPEPVAVLHSGLSATQRVGAWREVLEGRIRVVVGARSAIFAPVKDLGLIVVDEEHEESYKQQDPAPRYNARDVALVRGKRQSARVVLVSATPSLETLRLVDEGAVERFTLTQRFGSPWPLVSVVDRRREAADAPYVGDHLAREIENRMETGEGVLLLITRRGYAPVLVCRDCGHKENCTNCEVPFTYHQHRGTRRPPRLQCHHCGLTRRVPATCAECGGVNLAPLGAGTQRIEQELQDRFPALAAVRMDGDSVRGGRYRELLGAFASGDAGALVGTQLIAKGHDFEHVTLVGVINADPSLYQPDFRAAERTCRLLVQAAGRAGRGEKPGEMVVQSLTPEHPVFPAVMAPDLESFMAGEGQMRRELEYPPYARMILLTVQSASEAKAAEHAERLAGAFSSLRSPVRFMGPAPAYIPRLKRMWRWRMTLSTSRGADPNGRELRGTVRRVLEELPPASGVRVVLDVDPLQVV